MSRWSASDDTLPDPLKRSPPGFIDAKTRPGHSSARSASETKGAAKNTGRYVAKLPVACGNPRGLGFGVSAGILRMAESATVQRRIEPMLRHALDTLLR